MHIDVDNCEGMFWGDGQIRDSDAVSKGTLVSVCENIGKELSAQLG